MAKKIRFYTKLTFAFFNRFKLIIFIGFSTSALLFILYWLILKAGVDQDVARTFIFAGFGSYSLFLALSVRNLEKNIFSYSFFSNKYLLTGILIGVILMASAIYLPPLQRLFGTVPLSLPWVMAVIGVGILNIALVEVGKRIFLQKNSTGLKLDN